jgi:predicted TIM-barrel fold metal-dependent hydrolase
MARVDAHMHVWQAASGATPSASTLVPPQTDVPIEEARQVLAAHGIQRAVLVQPMFRGEDNSYVARSAQAEPDRFAAVCVVDPRISGADVRLAHWVSEGCRGLRLRPVVPEEEAVFGDPSTFGVWKAAERLGVVVSVLCRPQHVGAIAALAARFPAVPIVVDHLGQPDPSAGAHAPEFRELLALAAHPRVSIKTSGFYHFSRVQYPFDDCAPLVRAVYEHFGPGRMIWGSDYPHVTITCGYARSLDLPGIALADLPPSERNLIVGDNALSLYWPG